MNSLRALLADRKRSQRGSVLSSVLILTAFLAIIAGALMTELSTNFLLSRVLLNRVNTEATVNSAAELAINQLQATQLNTPCPAGPVSTPPLNGGLTAVASIVSCAAVVDRRSLLSSPAFTRIASSNPFQTDGTHAVLPGLNDYVVGDSGGTVFDFNFTTGTRRWALPLGGSVTGPPLVMPDSRNGGQYLELIPVSGPTCAPTAFCLSVRSDDGSNAPPDPQCIMAAAAAVGSQPAVGQIVPRNVFISDSAPAGNVYLMDPNQNPDNNGPCSVASHQQAGAPVVAGPVVFPCSCRNGDWVFVLTSAGGPTNLVRFSAGSNQSLSPATSFPLFPPSWGRASGVAVAPPGLPAGFAISFSGGAVAVVQINSAGNPTLTASRAGLPGGIGGPPYWCSCNLVGVGTGNGALYILDPNTNLSYAAYPGGPAIRTAPAADGAGNWYFAADDGILHEVPKPFGGTAMINPPSFGNASAMFRSSPVLDTCQPDICIYLASTDAKAYRVDLDARDVVLTACINTCQTPGPNPRLWTQVEVGVAGNTQAVHVQGWSYYSP